MSSTRARTSKAGTKRSATRSSGSVALALAGGGPLGAIYEIGALNALAESIDGLDLNGVDQYVGVSAGAFITAALANRITPAQLCRMFIAGDSARVPFDPARFLMPAYRELWRRSWQMPALALSGLGTFIGSGGRRGLADSFQRLTRTLPTGLFDNDGIAADLHKAFLAHGGTDDFRQLKSRLYLVATDLDTGEAVSFGAQGHEDVPISRAIQASAALPGLFPPVRIGDRWYVDGALKKTLHASVVLKEGADLVLCINPLVPFNAARAVDRGRPEARHLVEGGLPTVMGQTLRTMIHSRMEVGMARYELEFPDADIILFEPDHGDTDMFFTNPFSYASRQRLCEHAYQQTRAALRARAAELQPKLARHGLALRMEVLRAEDRALMPAMSTLQRQRSGELGRAALELQDTLDRLQAQLGRQAARQRGRRGNRSRSRSRNHEASTSR